MAYGDFTASKVPQLLFALDDVWAGARGNQNRTYQPKVEALRAVIENDLAQKNYVTTDDNCQGVKLTWLEQTGQDAAISTDEDYVSITCSPSGQKAESKSVTHKITKKVVRSFSVDDDSCDNLFDKTAQIAHLSMLADKQMLDKIAEETITRLHTYAGTNAYGSGGIGNVASAGATVTKIPKGNLNWADFVPYAEICAMMNRFADPYVLDGMMFYNQLRVGQLQAGTPAGDAGANNAFSLLRYYNDAFNFNKLGGSYPNRMFMIDRGAVAFAYRNQFTNAPISRPNDKMIYRAPILGSAELLGEQLYKDVTYQVTEVNTSGKCKLVHTWEFAFRFDFFLNPVTTGDTVTGVLEFEGDAALLTECSPAPYNCPPVTA